MMCAGFTPPSLEQDIGPMTAGIVLAVSGNATLPRYVPGMGCSSPVCLHVGSARTIAALNHLGT